MEISKQVCSLELAKKLKELGVSQKALCFWNDENKNPEVIFSDPKEAAYIGFVSAFTVAELGEILFKLESNSLKPNNFRIESYNTNEFNLVLLRDCAESIYINNENEANARATMLIYLIENKLIEVPK